MGLNWLIGMFNRISFDIPDWVPGIGGKHFGINIPKVSLPSFATGGVVPGPEGQPQLAIVHGGETIIPNHEPGNVNINFTQPVFFDREDTMNKFIDKISRTLDRRYRLSGRSLA